MLLAVSLAFAEPGHVGRGTGDHPVRYRKHVTEISCLYPVEVPAFYREGPPIAWPPHARRDFEREIAGSARRALPVARAEP